MEKGKYVVYCDGAVEPCQPGGHAVGGWVVYDDKGKKLGQGAASIAKGSGATSNVAEFGAVYNALLWLLERNWTESTVMVRTDSSLIVSHLNSSINCRTRHLISWRDKIWKLCEKFSGDVMFSWIPRTENIEADVMSRSLYPRGFLC